jgi:hypothetical protein
MVSRMYSTPHNSKGRLRLNIQQLVSRSRRKQRKRHRSSSRSLPNMVSSTTRTDKLRDMVSMPNTEDLDSMASMVDLRKDIANSRSN